MPCVLLSGEIACGKTSVGRWLATNAGLEYVSVRQALASILGIDPSDRRSLQIEGAALDRRTNGRWLVELLVPILETGSGAVVDSARTLRQTVPVLEGFGDALLVYLDASPATRRTRFRESALNDPLKRSMSFDRAGSHPTEKEIARLRAAAHAVVETDDLTVEQVVNEIQVLYSGLE